MQQLHDLVYPAVAARVTQNNAQSADYFKRAHRHQMTKGIPVGAMVMAKMGVNPGSKLQPRLEGPFQVMRRTRGGSYVLMCNGKLLDRDYAPSQLKVVSKVTRRAVTSEEEEDLDEELDEDEYVLEKIVAERKEKNGTHSYLVKWLDYPEEENTWVKETDFNDFGDIVRFWKEQGKDEESEEDGMNK